MAEVPSSLLRRERPPRGEGWLTLLDAFELNWNGNTLELPMPAQRLLAYLAIEDRPLHRGYVADALWLNSTEAHASGSLRSALCEGSRRRRPRGVCLGFTGAGSGAADRRGRRGRSLSLGRAAP